MFVISLFDDFEQTFTAFKPQLIRLLGSERTIPVSGNIDIFCWLLKRFRQSTWLKEIRKKDIALFRAMTELPVAFVKTGNRRNDVLLSNGYSAKDIIYLNSFAIRNRPTRDTMDRDSIVAEKIAIELCKVFINSKDPLPVDVCEHLEWILRTYNMFAIRIGGFPGIHEAIKDDISL